MELLLPEEEIMLLPFSVVRVLFEPVIVVELFPEPAFIFVLLSEFTVILSFPSPAFISFEPFEALTVIVSFPALPKR